jgi:hypothetical protein
MRARAARINCRWPCLPLTSGAHITEMARRARMRDQCDTAIEGPRRPITSASHVAHYARGCVARKGTPAAHDCSHDCRHLMARSLTE